MSKTLKNYFTELEKLIANLYKSPYAEASLAAVADKIAWCYKWRKITAEQKDILCDKIIELCDLI